MLGKMFLVGGNTSWRLSQYVKSDQVNGVEDYGGIAAELKLGPELFDCVRMPKSSHVQQEIHGNPVFVFFGLC